MERVDGALRLCERTPPERNGHEAATAGAAGIWVEGCFEPATAMRLLCVCKPGHTVFFLAAAAHIEIGLIGPKNISNGDIEIFVFLFAFC